MTGDLDGTLEALLPDFVAQEDRRRRKAGEADLIGPLNVFHAEHGLLSGEHQAF